MEYLYSYFITNFFLLCIILVMTIICAQKYHEHKMMSVCIFIIMGLVFALSVIDGVKLYTQKGAQNAFWTILLTSLSYFLRPVCLFMFILLSGQRARDKWFYILLAPLSLLLVVYVLPLIPATKDAVFTFGINEVGLLVFYPGNTPLRFAAHIVSAFYMIYLLYRNIATLQAKHFSHSLMIFICAFVVILAVVLETFYNEDGSLELLTTSIAISVVFYYLYLFTERAKYDPLTGLLNRAAYYSDLPKMDKDITGVIQIDMNGLKYLNDNFGHEEGDMALMTVSTILKKGCTRRMYVYRMGGDEFTVLVNKDDEGKIIDSIREIQSELAKTKYRCSIGYAFRKGRETDVEELIKASEKRMYEDKTEFYKCSLFERRQTVAPKSDE